MKAKTAKPLLGMLAVACLLGKLALAQDAKDKKEAPAKAAASADSPKDTSAAKGSATAEPPEFITFDNVGKMSKVKFPHAAHGKKSGCKACHEGEKPLFPQKHEPLNLKMADMYAGKGCGSCHNGKTAFVAKTGCMKCHKK